MYNFLCDVFAEIISRWDIEQIIFSHLRTLGLEQNAAFVDRHCFSRAQTSTARKLTQAFISHRLYHHRGGTGDNSYQAILTCQ